MKKISLILLAVILAVVGILASSALFTVHQTQQALVLQFGKPIRVENEPGLKIKLPLIQNVEYYERRILDLDPPPQQAPLRDQKHIIVDSFARYRIVDPLEFRKRAVTLENFRQVFGAQLNAAVRAEVGKVLLPDMLSDKRADVMVRITEKTRSRAPQFGIELIDVRIGRTDLPEATSQAVYNRMRSDRQAYAAQIRAEGEKQKLSITANADRRRTEILAGAEMKSRILHGEGDAQRTKTLIDAYSKDKDFFEFYRSLEAYKEAFGDDTTMIISPDSDFFKYFNESPGS